ncbi:hypothetical protein ACEWY4_019606 [Coilia grayii]|uniref:Ig-like domain-containing protein n=1 Tax=Coilia grayii TaxID=363190 RepID=A0ABD1JA70_9TELE
MVCNDTFIRWIKVAVNGATFLDTGCKQNCRISHQSVGESRIELTVRQVTKEDKGRYYCIKNNSKTPDIRGKGTFLHIADAGHSINRTEVNLLTEFSGSSQMLEYSRPVVLYCLVTGLVSPNINITWHSNQRHLEAGQTWLSDATEGFTAGSRLEVNVTTGKDSQNAEGQREEWWCELHQGNFTFKSSMSSLHAHSEPDWCPVVLYSAVAVLLLCVLSLVLLASHWVPYSRTGGESSVNTNIQPPQDDTSSGVGLQDSLPLTPRRRPNNPDVEVYSVLKC